MAIWMELRCDWRIGFWEVERECWSNVNSGPMDMASNSAASVSENRKFLLNDAEKSGWKKYGHNWACPACAEQIEAGHLPRNPEED